MAEKLTLLIIEDTATDIQSYKDAIKNVNQDYENRYIIEPVFESTKEGGLKKLDELKDKLDAAFIDLKLTSGREADFNEGNDIIKEIYNKLRFPVVVLTGTPSGMDKDFKESLFLKLETKGQKQYEEMIKEVLNIYRTGITKIFGENGELQKLIDKIFWKHLSNSLDYWVNDANEKTLLRYTLTHAIEYLETDEQGNFLDYNPAEVYLTPPTKPFLFTGTLLKENGTENYFAVLSPACDLAHKGKAKNIVLATIEPLTIPLIANLISTIKKEPSKDLTPEQYRKQYVTKEKARTELEQIIKNNYANKFHFLPDCTYFKGGVINFQYIQSRSSEDISLNFTPVALITPSFCKDIIARFSYYYSRQGSPDFDFQSIVKKYLND